MTDTSHAIDRTTDRTTHVTRCDDETLVADYRTAMTPSQHVEQKLLGLLGSSSVPVSQVQRWFKRRPR